MSSPSSSCFKRLLLLFLVCGLLCSAWPTAARSLDDGSGGAEQMFKEWTEKYNKHYRDEAELHRRQAIFADNLKKVPEIAEYARGHIVGLNQFADLTGDEFLASPTGFKLTPAATSE